MKTLNLTLCRGARFLLLLPLVITTLQTIAYLTDYDQSANYFFAGSSLVTVTTVLTLVGIAAAIALVCLLPKEILSTEQLPCRPASLVPTVGTLSSAILFLFFARNQALLPAVFLSLLLTVAYNTLLCIPAMDKKRSSIALLGYVAVFANALTTIYYYFDMTVEMNAPVKVSLQLGLLFSMLYYTGELRYLLGVARPRFFLMLSLWMSVVGALTVIPIPIAYFAGILNRTDYLAGAILILGVTIAAFVRAASILFQLPKQAKSLAEPNQNQAT